MGKNKNKDKIPPKKDKQETLENEDNKVETEQNNAPEVEEEVSEKEMEEAQLKLDFVLEEASKSRKKYFNLQKIYSKLAFILKFLSLALSAIVTIILGLNLEPTRVFNGIALSLSALTGVVSGLSAFFDFSALAVKYKDTCDKLDTLKVKIEYFDLGNNAFNVKQVSEFKDEYLTIMDETFEFFQKVKADEMEQDSSEEKS